MTAEVKRLPARDCRYFQGGRCLYEERRNPGYHQEWRCGVLCEWETAYDDFLDRAEAFSLAPADASRMWGERLKKLVARAAACPDYIHGGADSGTGCAYEFEALCLRLVPPCEGMCRRYERFGMGHAGGCPGE